MSVITQLVIALALSFLLDQFLKPYLLRKWLGVVLVAAGAVGCVVAGQIRLLGFDLGLLSVFAVAMGMGLFMKRRRFEQNG
jgi:Na+-transporting NADH:ubiquinone oxidoreductase subunit NqrD